MIDSDRISFFDIFLRMSLIALHKKAFFLGLPIIAGMLSQSILNLVDAFLVGQLGAASLAGVGIGGYANFVAVSLILGLSSSVQMLVARYPPTASEADKLLPVVGGIIYSIVVAFPISLVFIYFSESFLGFMNSEPAVQDIANNYFDWRTLGMFAVSLQLTCRGWWNGTHQSGHYLKILIATHILNVIVSYALIFGHLGLPRMGAAGAGAGTMIALCFGAFMNLFFIGHKHGLGHYFLKLSKQVQLSRLIRLSLPHSSQQLMLALSLSCLMWIIGKLGTQDQAIAYLLINISLFLILPAVGFGVASTSLISNALATKDTRLAYQWGWIVISVATLTILFLSTPLLVLPHEVLGLFLSVPEAIYFAAPLLQLTAVSILLDASAIVLAQALYGASAGKHTLAISTIGQWLFFLPMAWFVGVEFQYGLYGIWIVQLIHRGISALLFIFIWQQQRWKHNKVLGISR